MNFQKSNSFISFSSKSQIRSSNNKQWIYYEEIIGLLHYLIGKVANFGQKFVKFGFLSKNDSEIGFITYAIYFKKKLDSTELFVQTPFIILIILDISKSVLTQIY